MGDYDNNPGKGDRKTQKVVLERSTGLNSCLQCWCGQGNEKNSKIPVTQIENQEGKVGGKSATTDIFSWRIQEDSADLWTCVPL